MRPIYKGEWPQENGENVDFKKYAEARRFLIDRLGQYCSYCEQYLSSSLAVEHVQPKSLVPELELSWDNFLLGCTNCNSTKLNKPIELEDFVWPDKDNTYELLDYHENGTVKPKTDLSDEQERKVKNIIKLVGLDKVTPKVGTLAFKEASDRRWENRTLAWIKAKETKENYLVIRNLAPKEALEILLVATGQGFWSVWFTVFNDCPEVLNALINHYVGTCQTCFDTQGNPIERV